MTSVQRTGATIACAVVLSVGCSTDSGPQQSSTGGAAGMQAGAGKGGSAGSGASASGTAGNGAAAGTGGGADGGTGVGGSAGGGAGRGGPTGGTGGGSGGSGGTLGGGASAGSSATGGGGSGGAAGAGLAGTAGASGASGGQPIVYIGGSGSNNAYPFTTYDFNPVTGAFMARSGTTNLGPSPSYIALAPSKQFLVVTNENDDTSGGLTSASIATDGTLTKVNHVTGSDGGFTYVTVHSGGFALAASYNGGSLSVFPFGADGMLGAESDNMDFGSMAQTHCVAIDAGGTHLLVPNKGNDEVAQLGFDAGTLSANSPARVGTTNGAGPRHIAIHPNGKLAFVINELDSTMTPYQLATNGTLTAGTPVSTLPSGFSGQNTGAHVEVSPDGKFVYGSNRGHDSIVVFSANPTSGALTLVQHQPSGGSTPRDFDMDPNGKFIVVANQSDSKLAAFAIGNDGKLTPLGSPINGPSGCSAVQIAYVP